MEGIDGWLPGHVGIYVGEKCGDHDNDPNTPDKAYNVIEALGSIVSWIPFKIEGEVEANYYNPISEFAGEFNTTYMGARQPDSGALTSEQRSNVLNFLAEKDVIGKPYAGDETKRVLWGLARGDYVKGMFGNYNCVGLAEAAYESVGIDLVSDEREGNNASDISARAVFWPIEQYNETEPAEGYIVSGRVADSQGNGIIGVTLNLELVSVIIELITNSGGYWSSDKLGQEWNVTPQKDGYTFEPSTRKVKENANNIDFTGTLVTLETYTITASVGSHGSISPSGNIIVNQGLDKSFTITPDTGYSINDVLVDGGSVGAISSYTFTNVTEDHTISATFRDFPVDNMPVVETCSVNPTSVILGDSFNISYTVSDDIGLQQTELWRANDAGGEPGDWDTQDNPIFTKVLSGQNNYSGSFTDTPDTAGTYWYGIHVVNTSGNWSVEPKPPGPIVVTVANPTPAIYVPDDYSTIQQH